jgi:hypothetical protein
MTPEQIYQQLTEVAEKLDIRVSEKNLRKAGLRVRSGLCKVHGESVYIMDKTARTSKKISLLAECLALRPLDEVYLMPAVREVIDRNRPKQPKQGEDDADLQRMIAAQPREGEPEEREQGGPENPTDPPAPSGDAS